MKIIADILPGATPRITVEFAGIPNPEAMELMAESVQGGRWRNGIKRWVYPATVEKCREMRQVWGHDLHVRKPLAEWYRTVNKAQRRQARVGAREDASLPVVEAAFPALFADLAPDQRAGAAWVASAYRGAGLLAPEMGVGKTRTVVAGLVERQMTGRILIVCPKISVRAVWGKDLAKYTDWPVFLARGTREQRENVLREFWKADAKYESAGKPRVLVVVAEMLRIKAKLKNHRIQSDDNGKSTFVGFEYPELFNKKKPWEGIVVDESQKLLASTTVVKSTLAGFGLQKLPQSAGPTALRLAVTATPYGDGGEVHGMFGTLRWCWPSEYSSFWGFANENFQVIESSIGKGRTVKKIGPLRVEGGVEKFFQTLGPRVFRRTLEEVSPGHAGKLRFWIQDCEMEPRQRDQYLELSDNAELKTVGGVVMANGVLAEMTRARQVANGEINVRQVTVNRWTVILDDEGNETDEEELLPYVEDRVFFTGVSGKLETLMQALEERGIMDGRGKRKLVIASQFNEFLRIIQERLEREGVAYHYMTGSTTDNQRDRMMAAFQAKGGPRIFLMNSKAGGVSITLDAADEMHQMDEMYPPEANEQLHRRIFRRSRMHRAHIVYYRSEGTIDEAIADNVGAKLHQQLKTMDGRRGRDIIRKHIKYRGPK